MKIKPGFNLRNVCGEHVIVADGKQNIDFNSIISLNETSAFLWKAVLDRDFTVDDMVEALLSEYEVSEEVATADCKALAAQWIEVGIVAE